MACVSDEVAASRPTLAIKDTIAKMAIAKATKADNTSAPVPWDCHFDTTRGMLATYISKTIKSTMAIRVVIRGNIFSMRKKRKSGVFVQQFWAHRRSSGRCW